MSDRTVKKELKGCLTVLIVLLGPVSVLLIWIGSVEFPHIGSLGGLMWIGSGLLALCVVFLISSLWQKK